MALTQVLILDEAAGTSFGTARPFPIKEVSPTTAALANGTETAVAGTAVSVLAANGSRKWCVVQNTGTANVRIGITGVTATTGIQVTPGSLIVLEAPWVHQGAIYAIREGANSSTVFTTEAV